MTDDHIGLRADPALVDRIDSVGSRYGMNRSQMTREVLDYGLKIVEEDGIDALIDAAEGNSQASESDEAVAEP